MFAYNETIICKLLRPPAPPHVGGHDLLSKKTFQKKNFDTFEFRTYFFPRIFQVAKFMKKKQQRWRISWTRKSSLLRIPYNKLNQGDVCSL